MKKYFVKRGYFGKGGKIYISPFRFWIYRMFTDICLWKEVESKEICINVKGAK